MRIQDKSGIQPEIRQHFSTVGAVAVPYVAAPTNAVAALATISAAIIALMVDGDTVTRGSDVYTFDAASVVANREWRDVAELVAHVTALDDWAGTNNAGACEIRGQQPCAYYNGYLWSVRHVEATTAGGGAGAKGAATITAAAIAALAVGDTVVFDDLVLTRAAAPGAAAFSNQGELIALIDAHADWAAVNNAGDIDITSAANGAVWNGFEVVITFNRTTASGVDGTPGVIGAVVCDGTRIYISSITATVNNNGWLRTDALNFATY